jgi:prepilin peptidase CpaA
MYIAYISLLVGISAACTVSDVIRGKVPNNFILLGLILAFAFRFSREGVAGILNYLGGVLVPVLLLCPLYYFRTLGAGDIKLFAVLGGLMGWRSIILCVICALFIGAIISLLSMFFYKNLLQRIGHLISYFYQFFRTRTWIPYSKESSNHNTIHFTIPIFISVLLYIGGAY